MRQWRCGSPRRSQRRLHSPLILRVRKRKQQRNRNRTPHRSRATRLTSAASSPRRSTPQHSRPPHSRAPPRQSAVLAGTRQTGAGCKPVVQLAPASAGQSRSCLQIPPSSQTQLARLCVPASRWCPRSSRAAPPRRCPGPSHLGTGRKSQLAQSLQHRLPRIPRRRKHLQRDELPIAQHHAIRKRPARINRHALRRCLRVFW